LEVLSVFERLSKLTIAVQIVFADSLDFCATLSRSHTAQAAENLFQRKQLALFQEREKKATRTTAADRFVLAKLARFLPLISPALYPAFIQRGKS
jgi:hypothetical protein